MAPTTTPPTRAEERAAWDHQVRRNTLYRNTAARRAAAEAKPRAFLARHPGYAVQDEKAKELFQEHPLRMAIVRTAHYIEKMPGLTRRQLANLRAATGLTKTWQIVEWLKAKAALLPHLKINPVQKPLENIAAAAA